MTAFTAKPDHRFLGAMQIQQMFRCLISISILVVGLFLGGCGEGARRPAATKMNCAECTGTGRITGVCAVCNGTGQRVSSLTSPVTCVSCGGTGSASILCKHCGGTGKIPVAQTPEEQSRRQYTPTRNGSNRILSCRLPNTVIVLNLRIFSSVHLCDE
jgi:hypothetical protein